ncbi:MAG: hypothetical protein DMF82_25875 [Acidobacteria bacterium]|nr:MAG: hypothetical protein DMF82_25875 [Acidobacteriota bacterium]
MSSILVWGKTREIVTGALPPGINTEEVSTLSELKDELRAKGSILVLADASHLDAEREAVATWVKSGESRLSLLVGVAPIEQADELIRRHSYLDDVMVRPVTALRLRLRLDRALDGLNSRRVIQQLDAALADINKLLEQILAKSRAITASDAGTLYLVVRGKDQQAQTDDRLEFVLAQNESVPVSFEKRTVPLDESSIAGYVALSGQIVNVADAYQLPPGTPYTISRSWDERSGYRTKSMLVVPMRDHQGTVIGVVQLINKKREARTILRPVALVEEAVVPFTSVDEELVSSLASQAAVAFENTRLIQDIQPRPHDLGSFRPRGHADGRPRRDGRHSRCRPLPADQLQPRPAPGDPVREPAP